MGNKIWNVYIRRSRSLGYLSIDQFSWVTGQPWWPSYRKDTEPLYHSFMYQINAPGERKPKYLFDLLQQLLSPSTSKSWPQSHIHLLRSMQAEPWIKSGLSRLAEHYNLQNTHTHIYKVATPRCGLGRLACKIKKIHMIKISITLLW